jgi:hypothetical protein
MAREYCDLLTFPAGTRGIDTPNRLSLVALKLGFTCLGLYGPPPRYGVGRELDLLTVSDYGTKGGGRADLRIARGRRTRGAVSSEHTDFIIPDPRDRVTIRFAGKNDVPIAYSYSQLLKEDSFRRSNLLRSWIHVHQDAVRHGCREILVSGANDSYLLRNPRDLASLLVSSLDLHEEEALDWLSRTPLEIIDRARQRGRK